MEVIVDDTQLSLAIGKKGQNVRLAAKLLGWKIDIKSEEEKRQEVESQMAALVVSGRAGFGAAWSTALTEKVIEKLVEAGIGTSRARLDDARRSARPSRASAPEMVERIQEAVNGYYGAVRESGRRGGRGRRASRRRPTAEPKPGPSVPRKRAKTSRNRTEAASRTQAGVGGEADLGASGSRSRGSTGSRQRMQ